MDILSENFQWVEFNQERIATSSEKKIDLFEFSSLYPKGEPQFYCKLLLKKLLYLNRALLPRFLNYHCLEEGRGYKKRGHEKVEKVEKVEKILNFLTFPTFSSGTFFYTFSSVV